MRDDALVQSCLVKEGRRGKEEWPEQKWKWAAGVWIGRGTSVGLAKWVRRCGTVPYPATPDYLETKNYLTSLRSARSAPQLHHRPQGTLVRCTWTWPGAFWSAGCLG